MGKNKNNNSGDVELKDFVNNIIDISNNDILKSESYIYSEDVSSNIVNQNLSFLIKKEPKLENIDDYKKLIVKLEKELDEYKYKRSLYSIFADVDNININKEINGFGILVSKYNNNYKIVYNKTKYDIHGKVFNKYKLNEKKTLLIIRSTNMEEDVNNENVDHKLMIEKTICLDYSEDLLIDFNKDLLHNSEYSFNKKKKKVLAVLNDLYELSKSKQVTHGETAKRYNCKNLGFVIPSIVISAISGVVSFVASSNIIDEKAKTYMTIGVGILASFGTFLQSMSGALNYSGKSEAHTIATDEYDNINTNILFEMQNPNESINNTELFYEKIKLNILDVKKKCNYIIPSDIIEKYSKNKLNNRIKSVKFNLLEEAWDKKTDYLKNEITSSCKSDEINMSEIRKKLNFVIPLYE